MKKALSIVPFESLTKEKQEEFRLLQQELFPEAVIANSFLQVRDSGIREHVLLLEKGRLSVFRILRGKPPSTFGTVTIEGASSELILSSRSGQWIYSRPFYGSTCEQTPLSDIFGSSQDCLLAIKQLGLSVLALHAAGFAHGHICSSNIGIDGESFFLTDRGLFLLETQKDSAVTPELIRKDISDFVTTMISSAGELLPSAARKSLELAVNGAADVRVVLSLLSNTQSHRGKLLGKEVLPNDIPSTDLSTGVDIVTATKSDLPIDPGSSANPSNGYTRRTEVDAAPPAQVPLEVAAEAYSPHIFIVVISALLILTASISLIPKGQPTVKNRKSLERVLLQDWSSDSQLSRSSVAERALLPRETEARDVIVKSCEVESKKQSDINCKLLLFAFDNRWASELRERDRQLIFRLALYRLLTDNSRTVPDLDSLHPISLLVALGFFPGSEAPGFASSIETATLAKLPGYLGVAFSFMESQGVKNCQSNLCFFFSTLLVGEDAREVDSSESSFLRNEPLSLALFSHVLPFLSDEQIKSVLDRVFFDVTADPDLNQDLEEFSFSPRRLLEIFSGNDISELQLSFEELCILSYASWSTQKSVALPSLVKMVKEDGSQRIVEALSQNSNLFRTRDAVFLTLALTQSPEQRDALLRRWIEQEPNPKLVVALLEALSAPNDLRSFSLPLARYLKQSDYEPELETLTTLLQHNDEIVRAYSYSRLSPSEPRSRALLESMASIEPSAKLRASLERLLGESDGDLESSESSESEMDSNEWEEWE